MCRNIYAAQDSLPGTGMCLFVPRIVRALRFQPSVVSETRPQASNLHLRSRYLPIQWRWPVLGGGGGGGQSTIKHSAGVGGGRENPASPNWSSLMRDIPAQ